MIKIGYKNSSEYSSDDRKYLVLEWLYTFKFSDYDTLTEMMAHTARPKTVYGIVKRLEKRGFVTVFENPSYSKKLVAITNLGIDHLLANDRLNYLCTSEIKRVKLYKIKQNKSVPHWLGIQRAVYRYLYFHIMPYLIFEEIELMVEPKMGMIAPDAMVRVVSDRQDYKFVAIEYEQSQKNKDRTMYQLQQHCKNIDADLYHCVHYFFGGYSHYLYYSNKLEQREDWIQRSKNKISYKVELDRFKRCVFAQYETIIRNKIIMHFTV